jgi:hypothetical protein
METWTRVQLWMWDKWSDSRCILALTPHQKTLLMGCKSKKSIKDEDNAFVLSKRKKNGAAIY